MNTSRADPVVKVLTTIVSITYFGLWVIAVVGLVAAPIARLLAAGDPEPWPLGLVGVPVDANATVLTPWGAGQLVFDDVRGQVRLPLAQIPWGLVAVLWTHAAVVSALMLLALHHLRRIFQRVRDGAPFDAHNALRMRWVGTLLLTLVVFDNVAEFAASRVLIAGSESGITVGWPQSDYVVFFLGFVLVALAEIFRRGAELEQAQSLVI